MEASSMAVSVLVGLFVVLMLLQLRDFLTLLPYLLDSLFRARGSVAMENSIPVSRMRNNIAYTLLIPFGLLLYRYRLWEPGFMQDWAPAWRLSGVFGGFLLYLLLRYLLYLLLKPRRRYDFYQLSYKASLTYFILFCVLLLLPSFGLLSLLKVPEAPAQAVILAESAFFFLLLLLRRAQILALSCNHLRTFSYLCGLEILPAALWVLTATVL